MISYWTPRNSLLYSLYLCCQLLLSWVQNYCSWYFHAQIIGYIPIPSIVYVSLIHFGVGSSHWICEERSKDKTQNKEIVQRNWISFLLFVYDDSESALSDLSVYYLTNIFSFVKICILYLYCASISQTVSAQSPYTHKPGLINMEQ